MNLREPVQQTSPAEDEIDLLELWEGLVQEWRTVFFIVIIYIAMAGAYLLMASKQYEVRADIAPPLSSEISNLNYLNVTKLTPDSVYQTFILNVSPRVVAERLSKEPDVLEWFEKTEQDVLIKNIMDAITILLPEESKKNLRVDTGVMTSIIVNMPRAEDALTFANRVLNNTNAVTQHQLLTEQIDEINTQITGIDRSYNLTVLRLENENTSEVERLISNDNQEKAELKAKIKALKNKAEQDKKFRIKQLESDFQLASLLKINKPMDPLDYELTNDKRARINFKGNSPSRYWIGTAILDAEIKSLMSRKSNDPFISGLTELQNQLALLDVNEKVEILKKRTNFIPFSGELRELQSQKGKLLNALKALQNMEFNSYRIVSDFVKPTNPIKPKKSLILAVSAVLGVVLGVFVALIRRAFKKRKEVCKTTLSRT